MNTEQHNTAKRLNVYVIEILFNDKLIRRFNEDRLQEAFKRADADFESRDNVTHYHITYPNGDGYTREWSRADAQNEPQRPTTGPAVHRSKAKLTAE